MRVSVHAVQLIAAEENSSVVFVDEGSRCLQSHSAGHTTSHNDLLSPSRGVTLAHVPLHHPNTTSGEE